jgi:small subunit ribosomal protein S7
MADDEGQTTDTLEASASEDPKAAEEAEAKEEAPRPKAKPRKDAFELKLFGRYDFSEVEVQDPGLARYINLDPLVIPHTGGRWANRPFGKLHASIVERLINNMMRTEDFTGKKAKAYRVVRSAFALLEKRTKRNPIQILVDALENAAPREEVTRLRFGGISVPRAVDIAPSRRLDIALRNICTSAVAATFKNPKPVAQCLADEILRAAKGDPQSAAIAKKDELERIAASAR